MQLELRVNGESKRLACQPGDRLVDVLRRSGYVGVKVGCRTGDCGTCTIIVNGAVINCCLMFAGQAQGAEIVTIEGLAPGGRLHPLQEQFIEKGAVQCGFCIPGMILSAKVLLEHTPDPTEEQVREALSGNLCRCTGYEKPVRAVLAAAEVMRGASKQGG